MKSLASTSVGLAAIYGFTSGATGLFLPGDQDQVIALKIGALFGAYLGTVGFLSGRKQINKIKKSIKKKNAAIEEDEVLRQEGLRNLESELEQLKEARRRRQTTPA